MSKIISIALVLLVCSLPSLSYDKLSSDNITGIVYDAQTGQPLPGATLYIHEFEKGAISDQDGHFIINKLPSKDITMEVSFLGYETIIIKIQNNEELNIKLNTTRLETAEVVVTASNFVSQHENAVKIEALNAKVIHSSGSPSFIESLTSIPGIDLISRGIGIGKPVIRGLSNSNVLFLNNGIRMENYQFSEDHPYVTDESGIDHIEVIKGPASLLYGSEAIGGLINILPEHPATTGHIEGDLLLQWHSVSNGYSINSGLKGTSKQLSWGLRGGLKNHRDYLDGERIFVPNSRFSQQSAKTFLNWNNNKGYYKLSYEFNHLLPGMTNTSSASLVTKNEYKKTFWFQDLSNHILLSKNTFFIQNVKFNANASYQFNHRILNTDEKGEVDMQLASTTFELKSWIPTGENSHLILGFQGANRRNKNNEAQSKVLPDYSENDRALMSLYQIRLYDKVSIQSGLRYDHRDLNIPEQGKSSQSQDNEEETISEMNLSYNNASFSTGATAEITHNFIVRANIATAFRPPNVAELTQDGIHGTRYEIGNSELNSQRNYESDLSFHYHTENFSVDLAGFVNIIDNYIYLSPSNEYENEYRIYQYMQDNAHIIGSEINIHYYPIKCLQVNAQSSTIRGTQEDGENLPFIPHNKISFGIKLEKEKIGKLQHPYLSLEMKHAFSQDHPSEFETSTPAYSLLNMGLGSYINLYHQKLNMTIIANNLMNKVYYDHLSTIKDIGYFNPGRNIALTVQWKF
jgi:iron complex outermembrane receptor protein